MILIMITAFEDGKSVYHIAAISKYHALNASQFHVGHYHLLLSNDAYSFRGQFDIMLLAYRLLPRQRALPEKCNAYFLYMFYFGMIIFALISYISQDFSLATILFENVPASLFIPPSLPPGDLFPPLRASLSHR